MIAVGTGGTYRRYVHAVRTCGGLAVRPEHSDVDPEGCLEAALSLPHAALGLTESAWRNGRREQ